MATEPDVPEALRRLRGLVEAHCSLVVYSWFVNDVVVIDHVF